MTQPRTQPAMAVRIRGRNVPLEPSLVRLARRRVTTALRRAHSEVRRVDVRLVDLNGPRGGVDQRCRITLELKREGRPIVAEATDARIEVAIASAAGRLARQVHRQRERAAGQRRPRA
ncbi:MAG: HPF/RaiA family ribosome-associated protein [Nannocystaceae bacterium]|nr:HPF/RaiA family ribosome-associated protein [Nannocystaceae bacterium]